MTTVTVATFNLAWFGSKVKKEWELTETRLQLVARSLAHIDADVVVFEEICDTGELSKVCAGDYGSPGRAYSIGDKSGELATAVKKKGDMRVVLAFDVEKWWAGRSASLYRNGMERPLLLVELRHKKTQKTLTVIGVHLKSPSNWDSSHGETLKKRQEECDVIADLAAGQIVPQSFASGLGEHIVLAGDFNGTIDGKWKIDTPGVASASVTPDPELADLRARLDGWYWPRPHPDDDRLDWTTAAFGDHAAIDFIVVSPELAPGASPCRIHRLDKEMGKNWLGVCTDHRPVTMDIEL